MDLHHRIFVALITSKLSKNIDGIFRCLLFSRVGLLEKDVGNDLIAILRPLSFLEADIGPSRLFILSFFFWSWLGWCAR